MDFPFFIAILLKDRNSIHPSWAAALSDPASAKSKSGVTKQSTSSKSNPIWIQWYFHIWNLLDFPTTGGQFFGNGKNRRWNGACPDWTASQNMPRHHGPWLMWARDRKSPSHQALQGEKHGRNPSKIIKIMSSQLGDVQKKLPRSHREKPSPVFHESPA